MTVRALASRSEGGLHPADVCQDVRMGKLRYGTEEFEFEDRLLAHLMLVVNQKARRREGFLLSWTHRTPGVGEGRSSIWITAGSNLGFQFSGSREASVNGAWLSSMMDASFSTRGLDIDAVREPGIARAS